MKGADIGICRMCGEERKLIEAHIIPRSLYPFENGEPLVKTYKDTPTGEVRQGASRKGEYDSGIVCEECERLFSKPDDYACDLFKRRFDDWFTVRTGVRLRDRMRYYECDTFEYDLLKRFVLSLLWRAHHSQRSFFKRVDVGPKHEKKLKQFLTSEAPIPPETYPFTLRCFDSREHQVVMDPVRERIQQRTYYRFYFLHFILDVQVDNRSMPYPLGKFNPSVGKPLWITEGALKSSMEFTYMVEMIQEADARKKKKMLML
jgi:hypothetical protein